MRETGRGVASRVRGRGALVGSLWLLLIRVHRFGALRATTDAERRWAGALADRLAETLREAQNAPGVPAGLAAADVRARLTAKAPGVCAEPSR